MLPSSADKVRVHCYRIAVTPEGTDLPKVGLDISPATLNNYNVPMAEANGGKHVEARAQAGSATSLVVTRWRRYGKDRLYVNGPDGTRVGWLDLQTGVTTVEVEDRRAEFEAAVAGHTEFEVPASSVPQPGQASDEPSHVESSLPPTPEEPWTDLAGNRAGQAVSTQAKQAFANAPVRTVAARLLGVHTDERAWRIGAKGEALVGKQLATLDAEWRVLHSVPVGARDSDIDHVVIGPGGVFTINAKHHPNKEIWVHRNTFIVGSTRTRYIHAARYEADRAQRLLTETVGFPVRVVGLIAVIGAHKGFTVKEQPRDGRVIVLTRKGLAQWLGRLSQVLDSAQVEAVFEVARRSTTWTATP